MTTPPPNPDQVMVVPWVYWVTVLIQRLLLRVYFRQIVVAGREYLPRSGPLVLAPKHYSRWDPVVLALLSLEPFWFMANANQFGGFQGWLIRRLGAFPVDLDHPRVSSFRYAVDLLRQGKKLMLFPEGGIVRDQPLRSLKPGLARLVLQVEHLEPAIAGIPIVPVAIHYDPAPIWRATIRIRIGEPLYARDYQQANDKQTAVALTVALESALRENLKQIGSEQEATMRH